MSLFVLGAFGAGAKALERRNQTLEALERVIRSSRNPALPERTVDLTVKVLIGGIREVTAARLRQGRSGELPELAEELAAWAASYPPKLPAGLKRPEPARGRRSVRWPGPRLRAGAARGGPPAERPPRPAAPGRREKPARTDRRRDRGDRRREGLAGLTIPEIASRANVSHQTFYEIYPTKHDAFLGAQKVGMHQALLVTAEAYDAHKDDWPRGVAAGLRALIDYLASEPAHAHLSLVDTFAASPDAIEIRDSALHAFSAYLTPAMRSPPRSATCRPSPPRR